MKHVLLSVLIPLLLPLFSGCAVTPERDIDTEAAMLRRQGEKIIKEAKAGAGDSTIRPKDKLTVEIWLKDGRNQFDGFPFERDVPQSGEVFIPHFGVCEAAGKSNSQLEEELTRFFSRILKEPTVVVEHEQKLPPNWRQSVLSVRHVTVMGWVSKPGLYRYEPGVTVREIIAHAGDLRRFADTKKIYLVRGDVREPDVHRINIADILKGKDLRTNYVLQPNDALYVPPIAMWKTYDAISKALLPISAVRDAVWVAGSSAVRN
ncbi:MAG: polysaccharide biosynthesis/export family protein [Kiritimatiellia bacterium]